MNRLTDSIATIDAVTKNNAENEKRKRVIRRAYDYIDEGGEEFQFALDEIGYEINIRQNRKRLAYAIKIGDMYTGFSLISDAIIMDLIKQAENEDE